MDKIRIRLVVLGNVPRNINYYTIIKWKSDLFRIIDKITLPPNSDLQSWGFSDKIISQLLPDNHNSDILISITSVPLQDNYYVRRFSNNRICITLFETGDFLKSENIPLENLIIRLLYSASFVYQKYGRYVPENSMLTDYTHDETKGCVFDMNGIKRDIIYSTNQPILCDYCISSLREYEVNEELIYSGKRELIKINKKLYYRISDMIKKYPICAIILSSVVTIILGAIGSIVASYLYDSWRD